ncbi:MAG: nitroreductase [Pseudomonadota bacterium]|jgi:nitroreductase
MKLPAPEFGQALPPAASPDALALLARRRSSSAQTLHAPGPSEAELDQLLTLAARVPDHGKLAPWRFLILAGAAKAKLVEKLKHLAAEQADPVKAKATLAKLAAPPLTIAVISRPVEAPIPLWEQELSAGAVCMTLLIAAEAMGFGANWITDWYAYDARALALIGVGGGEKLAGFIHLGTPAEPPLERARPDLASLVSRYEG